MAVNWGHYYLECRFFGWDQELHAVASLFPLMSRAGCNAKQRSVMTRNPPPPLGSQRDSEGVAFLSLALCMCLCMCVIWHYGHWSPLMVPVCFAWLWPLLCQNHSCEWPDWNTNRASGWNSLFWAPSCWLRSAWDDLILQVCRPSARCNPTGAFPQTVPDDDVINSVSAWDRNRHAIQIWHLSWMKASLMICFLPWWCAQH